MLYTHILKDVLVTPQKVHATDKVTFENKPQNMDLEEHI